MSEKAAKPITISKSEGHLTVGKPKSNKPWKKLSEKKTRIPKTISKSWKRKLEDRQKLKALKTKMAELREERKHSVSPHES